MMSRSICWFVALATLTAGSSALVADELEGEEKILCTPVQATVCHIDGECEIGPPWNWGVPQFIEIDFEAQKLSTTKAAAERRETPFKNFERSEGLIFLQGVEQGRAFSFVIDEVTGMLSAAVARDQITVSIFGACTPIQP